MGVDTTNVIDKESDTPEVIDYINTSKFEIPIELLTSSIPPKSALKTYVTVKRGEGDLVNVVINLDLLKEMDIRQKIRQVLEDK